MKAFGALCEHLTDEIINKLPRVVVFAPSPGANGKCLSLIPAHGGDDAFIYLAPSLERHPQADVDFTVAHEFAHALLRHHLPENTKLSESEVKEGYLYFNSEKAADELVLDWGFELPPRRKR